MAQLNNKLRSCRMQLMAYGQQNLIYNNKHMYVLNFMEIEMDIVNELEVQTSKYKYVYEFEMGRFSDQYKIQGIMIELDKDIEFSRPISNEIHKLTLEIYSYKMNDDYKKIDDEINFIGSIPLVIGKITNIGNSLIIKLPNLFFSSETKYFNNYIDYKFKISSPIEFKKISVLNILRYDDTIYSNNIARLSSVFYELDYQYVISDNFINPIITNDIFENKIIFEKKIISLKEKSNGIYLTIPEELTEFINKIEFNFNFEKKIISNDELEIMYKIKDTNYVNLYLIKFDYPKDLEPTNLLRLEFKYENNDEDYKNKINKLSDDIYVYPIVFNKLVCVNHNLGLKYLDGKINTQFNEQEQKIMNKYSNNIDLLTDNFMNFNIINGIGKISKHKFDKLYHEKFILEYIGQ
jgi:hypothetical protein